MGSVAIFSGNNAKLLKPNLDLFGATQILTGTTDPTAVAVNATAGSMYMNTSSGLIYRKTDAGSTTNWVLMSSTTVIRSEVYVDTPNGYGSTGTKIPRFTTIRLNTGSDITYADSATNGASFTINVAGIYAIDYSEAFTSNDNFGISVNSSSLTTSIATLGYANGFRGGTQTLVNNSINEMSITLNLAAADVVRPQTTGATRGAGGSLQFMRVVKVNV